MNALQSPTMGRKKSPPKRPTAPIRVYDDLAGFLGTISRETKRDIAEVVDPVLRPFVTQLFAEVLEQMRQKAKKSKEGK